MKFKCYNQNDYIIWCRQRPNGWTNWFIIILKTFFNDCKIDRYIAPFHRAALESPRNLRRNETVNADIMWVVHGQLSWVLIVEYASWKSSLNRTTVITSRTLRTHLHYISMRNKKFSLFTFFLKKNVRLYFMYLHNIL